MTKRKGKDVSGYYKLLGVSPNAGDDEVKAAAKAALRSSHPDTGGDTETFIKVSEAWRALSSPARRAAYDSKEVEVSCVTVASSKQAFNLPESMGEPQWFKEPQDILSELDIALVKYWQNMLLRTAHEFGTALEIKAGISKSLAGFEIVDDIAVIGANEVPQRWAAMVFILKRMVENYEHESS